MATEKNMTDFNLHIGGDGVKSDIKVPRETTLFGMTVFTCGCIAYLVKSYVAKARNK